MSLSVHDKILKLWRQDREKVVTEELDVIAAYFKEQTDDLKNQTSRDELPEDAVVFMIDFQDYFVGRDGCLEMEGAAEVLAACMRCIRNACAYCTKNQEFFCRSDGVNKLCKTLQLCARLPTSLDMNTAMSCAVQALGNASVNHTENQLQLARHLQLFNELVHRKDFKLIEHTFMVLHTCALCKESRETLFKADEVCSILTAALDHSKEEDSVFSHLFLKLFFKSSSLTSVYPRIDTNGRRMLLDYLSILSDSDEVTVHEDNLTYLCGVLQDCASTLVEVETHEAFLELLETRAVKSLVASLSAWHDSTVIKNDSNILKCAVDILHKIHRFGQELPRNAFTPVEKSTDASDASECYNLRTNLLQLLAILIHASVGNQNQIREVDGLALILDQTGIDMMNPFQREWAVFAIRNACEGNEQNQAYLKSLKLEGLAETVEQLQQYGYSVELDGGKIRMKPTGNSA